MRIFITAVFLALFVSLSAQQKSILGFSGEAAKAEFVLEEKFDAGLKADNLDQWMKRLSARPHHLGSPYGKANADYILNLFKSWGYDAQLETYKVLFPTPRVRVLEMTSPSKYVARLSEPPLKEDATSGQTSEQLPPYNAWSADGDVKGELVFVNYGIPADYEQLERLGIDVKGKIVIAKYGGSWRGIKPKVAQEHGAIGCIIYSDPKEDGYFQGDVYPKGAFKNQYGAQRGSVLDMPVYPGDPLTPGLGATSDAKRINRSEATNLIRIPVLPISYSDAIPLLTNLAGPVAPEKWRGALALTYHVGPGPVKVHLKLEFDWRMVDCYDVIARLKGGELPDEWVIRGNHHDGWVNGASDPISGLVAELEEARVLSELVKTGWKPKRTIVFCAWDGEEPGLIGSTEWVEDHATELQQKAVAYINSDSNGRGFLSMGGSHTLEPMMGEVARDVMDPQMHVTAFERSKSSEAANATTTKSRKEILAKKAMTLGALGSGSDYSPFIQHLGIPSIDIGYGGENAGGEYHSIYDSYDNYKAFKDPKFEYGIALAKTGGRIILRFADAEILPFDFKSFQSTLSVYLAEVIDLLTTLRETTEAENQMIFENRYTLASDPTKKYFAPAAKTPVPYLDFSSVQNAVSDLERSATAFATLMASGARPDNQLNHLNKVMYQAEQKLITPNGLPQRSWYKHTIYAPGLYTGYGVKTLPGIREAIEQRNWREAQLQIEIAAQAIRDYTLQVVEANELMSMR
jgi:N-acetylated-alpha-linked acidic dipeptidase